MITNTLQMTLLVEDQEEAKKFYTEKLGFDVVADQSFGAQWRYITVAPQQNNTTVIELVKAETPEQKALIGKQSGGQVLFMFHTDNIMEDYDVLHSRGVQFHSEPQSVPGGKGAGFKDLYGNDLDMFQPD
ncbi:VOC family protein [Aureibacillus halotolerans]|uniref:Catechol 2,3-dioxygenase-like lactoylglutathione lyase family enzyme n=1 Tax=Aureibacillus halotolerans TaxID=1508390 RepID=A0A4R6U9Q6_9BACI|nr:VOC family protein [Aureibacillus halotolerans]TDQ39804.1 catechol 2,3-dioxygenase-like lactoylglutathione lyase family enzyme [Aureibacillus halotolerans]